MVRFILYISISFLIAIPQGPVGDIEANNCGSLPKERPIKTNTAGTPPEEEPAKMDTARAPSEDVENDKKETGKGKSTSAGGENGEFHIIHLLIFPHCYSSRIV